MPSIRGDGLILRPPIMDDFPAWAGLREASRSFLTPWEPIWPRDDLTRASFRRRVSRYGEDIRADANYPFFIFDAQHGTLLGGLTFGNVRRGVAQIATLGYWMGERHAGRGIMTRAVRVGLDYAYGPMSLRRIEAGCVPHNQASINVLEANGFQREGYAREYLCIAGVWEDHILYARLKGDPYP